MEKEFIPYEQALEVKELGFNEECMAIYFTPTQELILGKKVNEYTNEVRVYAPLYQQAFRWFREKYDLTFGIRVVSSMVNHKFCAEFWECDDYQFITFASTYEEAELACLKKLIEIAKKK